MTASVVEVQNVAIAIPARLAVVPSSAVAVFPRTKLLMLRRWGVERQEYNDREINIERTGGVAIDFLPSVDCSTRLVAAVRAQSIESESTLEDLEGRVGNTCISMSHLLYSISTCLRVHEYLTIGFPAVDIHEFSAVYNFL